MSETTVQFFSMEEMCFATDLPAQTIVEIVEQGIIEPDGETPQNWVFTTQMIVVTKKACRLHADLRIDWSGIALALKLIDQLEQLRAENRQLRNRLDRFHSS